MSAAASERELDAVALLLGVRGLVDKDDPRSQVRILVRMIAHLTGTVPTIDWRQVARISHAAASELQRSPRTSSDGATLAAVRLAADAATHVGE
ncbi:MAG TPA: hypothetical protein VGV67_01085 [Solirubrobacteraceae bacterium]|nr:hypothetical protein [Solirubrobacteraceae bacterium]